MSDIRTRATTYLNQVPQSGITSNGATAGQFTKLTGATQAALQKNWAGGGQWTTCNEFVGHYGRALGAKDYLGRFDIDTYLKSVGKAHAWIPRTNDALPKPGDIFLVRSGKELHMGVSLELSGDKWTTVESGQGGPKSGCDIIKKINSSYSSRSHIGWVDIDLYFDAATQSTAPPAWLLGWWVVSWRTTTYYYHFDRARKVRWSPDEPVDLLAPMYSASDVGSYGVAGQHGVTIRWSSTGSIEKMGIAPTTDESLQMVGTWNDKERLTAVKIG